jgi:hypothetical protein
MLKRILLVMLMIVASAAIATAQKAQKNFYNQEFKAGFKYPATWKLSTKNFRPLERADEGFKNLAEVSMPTSGNVGAFATLAAGKVTADKCMPKPAVINNDGSVSEADKPKLVKMGTLSFYKSEEVWGGTESETDLEHYETFHEGVCYDVTLGLPQPRYHRKGMSDEALFKQLYVVLRTLYFGK